MFLTRSVRSFVFFCCFAVFSNGLLITPLPATAQTPHLDIIASNEQGYARLTFTFPQKTNYKLDVFEGVFAIRFDDDYTYKINDLPENTYGVIFSHRIDPDQKGLRFALNSSVRIVDRSAAEFLIIDLLPLTWTEDPPPLPKAIVSLLKDRAEQAAADRLAGKNASRLNGARNAVFVKAADNPTFTRIIIEGYGDTTPLVARRGKEFSVTFPFEAAINLDTLRQAMPERLNAVDTQIYAGESSIIFEIDPSYELRTLPERTRFLIDIIKKKSDAPDDDLVGLPRGGADAILSELGVTEPGGIGAETTFAAQLPEGAERPLKPSDMQTPEPVTNAGLAETETGRSDLLQNKATGTIKPIATVPLAPAAATNPLTDSPERPAASQIAPLAHDIEKTKDNRQALPPQQPDEQSQSKQPNETTGTDNPEADIPPTSFMSAVHPDTPALAFARGNRIFILFESADESLTTNLKAHSLPHVKSVTSEALEGFRLITLHLDAPQFFALYAADNQWRFDLGTIEDHESVPRKPERVSELDGIKAIIPLSAAGQTHNWVDPLIGDSLILVPAGAPTQPVLQGSRTVDFEVISSLHGVVIAPLSQKTTISASPTSVIIDHKDGLRASPVKASYQPEGTPPVPLSRTMTFAEWHKSGTYTNEVRDLMKAIAEKPENSSTEQRMDLAKFFIARALGEEATGALDRVASRDILARQTPLYKRLDGIANLLINKVDEAEKAFNSSDLIVRDAEMAPWIGLLASRKGSHEHAALLLKQSMPLINEYPKALRHLMYRAFFESSFIEGDFSDSQNSLFFLNRLASTPGQRAELPLLKARISEALGQDSKAETELANAIRHGYPPVENPARLALVNLALRTGRSDVAPAINELQNIAVAWRGDQLEVDALSRAAELYLEQKNYHKAFNTVRQIAKYHPDDPNIPQLHELMSKAFTDLFLGKAKNDVEPIKKLALFYDFAEYTPIGAEGDRIIRALVDSLYGLNLLDQASTLLDYQIEKRLQGAARAEIAADAAVIHLANKAPMKAIDILHKTRMNFIPETVKNRRLLLEARALISLNRPQAAFELIQNIDGKQADLIRIEALLKGEHWQDVAEHSENFLGERWRDPSALNEQERHHVLKAAVGYAMAGDKLGLGRLQQKFSPLMLSSPDAAAFNVLTDTSRAHGRTFSEIADRIASVNSFEDYLDEEQGKGLNSLSEPAPPTNPLPADNQAAAATGGA